MSTAPAQYVDNCSMLEYGNLIIKIAETLRRKVSHLIQNPAGQIARPDDATRNSSRGSTSASSESGMITGLRPENVSKLFPMEYKYTV